MMTENAIYWITRLDNIRGASIVVCLVCVLLFIFAGFLWSNGNDSFSSAIESWYKKRALLVFSLALMVFLCGLGTLIFVPSTKEMVAIKLIPMVSNSEFVKKELPEEYKELYKLAKHLLVEQVKKGDLE